MPEPGIKIQKQRVSCIVKITLRSLEAQQGCSTPGNPLFAVQCIPTVVK